jgi:hypothetical protein
MKRESPYFEAGEPLIGEPGTPVEISFDGSVATASALEAGLVYMFQSDQDCHIVFGETPTATTANVRLVANMPYYFTPSAALKVAAIKGSSASAGTLQITKLTRYSPS